MDLLIASGSVWWYCQTPPEPPAQVYQEHSIPAKDHRKGGSWAMWLSLWTVLWYTGQAGILAGHWSCSSLAETLTRAVESDWGAPLSVCLGVLHLPLLLAQPFTETQQEHPRIWIRAAQSAMTGCCKLVFCQHNSNAMGRGQGINIGILSTVDGIWRCIWGLPTVIVCCMEVVEHLNWSLSEHHVNL